MAALSFNTLQANIYSLYLLEDTKTPNPLVRVVFSVGSQLDSN